MSVNNLFTKKTIIIIIAMTIMLLGFVVFSSLFSKTPEGVVRITNLSKCTRLDKKTRNNIETMLYYTVTKANDINQNDSTPGYEGKIRKDTCNILEKSKKLSSAEAIVDIEKAKQSWRISYEWGSGKDTVINGPVAECVSEYEIIYKPFDCKKVINITQFEVETGDPIAEYTPYYGTGFEISFNVETSEVTAIIIVPKKDVNNTELIENNKKAVESWFEHRGLDMSKYSLIYDIQTKQ